jgi:uncharacterized protein HemX
MKKLLLFVLLLAVVVGVVGYVRGWYTVSENKKDIQFDAAKFDHDKKAASKKVSEDAKLLKEKAANLWKKTEGLTGDDKVQAQKDLGELQSKHDRIEKQIKDLDEAGEDKFAGIEADLKKSLQEVEDKIKELSAKLEKGKGK